MSDHNLIVTTAGYWVELPYTGGPKIKFRNAGKGRIEVAILKAAPDVRANPDFFGEELDPKEWTADPVLLDPDDKIFVRPVQESNVRMFIREVA